MRKRGGSASGHAADPERVPVDTESRNESSGPEPAAVASDLEPWFAGNARDLPWRRRRTGYRVLVSEAMLQQTQVSRVADRFPRFVGRFPTIQDLASSPIDDVLQEWEGLGYYRRARLLHAAAGAIVERHGGRVPSDAAKLRALPGVGPYTAGAVASLAFGRREAIVDGNVGRVLIRLAGKEASIDDPKTLRWCWSRSRELVEAAADPAVLNEGLMELGATICTPRSPSCGSCPVAGHCKARRLAIQDRIPVAKRRPSRRQVVHHVLVLPPKRRGTRMLATVQRRAPNGLWASMWEFPTVETDRPLQARTFSRRLGLAAGDLRRMESFSHATTHREVRFVVFEAISQRSPTFEREVSLIEVERLGELAMSVPQRRIADAWAARWATDVQPSSRWPED